MEKISHYVEINCRRTGVGRDREGSDGRQKEEIKDKASRCVGERDAVSEPCLRMLVERCSRSKLRPT